MRLLAQFFAAFLGLLVIIKTYHDFRSQRESLTMFLFWTVVWATISIVAFFPGLVDIALTKFGGGQSGVGTLFGMGLIFILFILYRLYVKMERVEREVTKLIKDIALKDL